MLTPYILECNFLKCSFEIIVSAVKQKNIFEEGICVKTVRLPLTQRDCAFRVDR